MQESESIIWLEKVGQRKWLAFFLSFFGGASFGVEAAAAVAVSSEKQK